MEAVRRGNDLVRRRGRRLKKPGGSDGYRSPLLWRYHANEFTVKFFPIAG